MSKQDGYYDYATGKFVECDPSMALTTQVLGMTTFLHGLKIKAERREAEQARRAKEDKSPFYKMYEFDYDGEKLLYVKKFLRDTYKQYDTWNDRLQAYNDMLIAYIDQKSYMLKPWQKSIYYSLSLKQYKVICKEVLKI